VQWAKVGFNYWNIPFEKEAYANERHLGDLFKESPYLLYSIQAGGSIEVGQQPDTSGWTDISSISNGPLDNGLAALSEFNGALYIDGINLTGVFNWGGRR
jgi:hypothetical protein